MFVLSPVGVVSFLLRQRVVVRQAVGSCLACVRVEAFGSFLLLQRSYSAELRVLLGSGELFGELLGFGRKLSRLLGSSCEWWLLLLGSWSFLFSILVPGLVRLIGLFLEVVPRGSDASTGRIGASSHQHVLRSAGGFAGAREGSRRLDPARSHWSPGPCIF